MLGHLFVDRSVRIASATVVETPWQFCGVYSEGGIVNLVKYIGDDAGMMGGYSPSTFRDQVRVSLSPCSITNAF